MILNYLSVLPLLALLLKSKSGWSRILSYVLIGLSCIGILLGTWFLIDLYDETVDFRELQLRNQNNYNSTQ